MAQESRGGEGLYLKLDPISVIQIEGESEFLVKILKITSKQVIFAIECMDVSQTSNR